MGKEKAIALIIGGSGGIGRASAEILAARGFRLVVADVGAGDAQNVAKNLAGGGHFGLAIDIRSEAEVAVLFTKVERDVGPITILANCAGVAGYLDGRRPTLADTPLETWQSVFAINATGVFLAVREMLRHRSQAPVANGRIINIASMAAQNGGGNSPASYTASKGAVIAFTKALAIEAAKLHITANCIAPGAIDTPMLRAVMPADKDGFYFSNSPVARAGTPYEVAAAVAFLASPEASYVTGACIDVNGGMRMN